MKFLKNYQNALKGRRCDHNYFSLDNDLMKCSKCYRIIEMRY